MILDYIFKSDKNKNGHDTRQSYISIGDAVCSLKKVNKFAMTHGLSQMTPSTSYVWKQAKGEVRVYPDWLHNPHITIAGSSGLGKSTLIKSMIIDAKRMGVGILLFDSNSEHSDVVNSIKPNADQTSAINIFAPDGLSIKERISELVSLLQSVYSLGYIQANELARCMGYMYRKAGAMSLQQTSVERLPGPNDLAREINIFIKNSKSQSEKHRLYHILNRIESLDSKLFSQNYKNSSYSIGSGIRSFKVSELKSQESRYIFTYEALSRLYYAMRLNGISHKLKSYVVMDEVEFIIGDYASNSSIIKRIIREGRKYGLGLIIATHSASSLPKDVIENSATFITFRSEEPGELRYASSVLLRGQNDAASAVMEKLGQIGTNECMARLDGLKAPVLVKSKSYRELSQHLNATFSAEKQQYQAPIKPVRLSELPGFTAKDVNPMRSDPSVDILEDGNDMWLMKHSKSVSISHEVNVKLIYEWLSSNGVMCYILDNSTGPDIVAYIYGLKTAIEYETGKKSYADTASMLKRRSEDFDLVVVFAESSCAKFYADNFQKGNIIVFSSQLYYVKEPQNYYN